MVLEGRDGSGLAVLIGFKFIAGVGVLSSSLYSGVSISFAVSVFPLVCSFRDLGKLKVKISIHKFTKATVACSTTPIHSIKSIIILW